MFNTRVCSVVFIVDEVGNRVLLGRKKAKVGVGCFTGPGGKRESTDSSIEAGAVREVKEETGLTIKPELLDKRAVLTFHNYNEEGIIASVFIVHFFIITEWEGEPRDSPGEMTEVGWYPIEEIFGLPLMASDHVWLPRLLIGEKLKGTIELADGQSRLIRAEIETVDSF